MFTRGRPLTSILSDRAPLALFAALTVGWFLPGVIGPYAPVALPLYLPAYLVSMVTYDGLLGLEHVVYAVQKATGVEAAAMWDAGLVLTFYLFSITVAVLGRPLERRFGPDSVDDETADRGPSIRYTVAAGLLLVGLLLVVQGVVAQPMATTVSCTDSGSAAQNGSASTATTTPECTRTTEPATGAQFHIVGLGTAVGLIGAGIVAVDRWLAARS